MQPAYIINGNNVVVVMDGKQYHATAESNSAFDKILEYIKEKRWSELPSLFDLKKAIVQYASGLVKIQDNMLYFDNEPLHDTISSRILDMHGKGFDIAPMARFLENLMANPSRTAVKELYLFLETGKMPITEDGCFLAYKKVRDNFHDIYTGKFDNSPGKVVEVRRNEVDDERDNTCSYGLHFCSVSYLNSYGAGPGNKVVIVKINPRDVVSIPSDYRNTKGRCCKYFVVGEYTDYTPNKEYFDSPVYEQSDFEDRGWENSWEASSTESNELSEEERRALQEEYEDLRDDVDSLTMALEVATSPALRDSLQKEINEIEDKLEILYDQIW